MVKGSCLCGALKFEIDPVGIAAVVACHCTNCRKVSGSAFGVYYQVRRDGFRWLCDDPLVWTYESSPGNQRGFCPICGAVAPVETHYGAVRVPGGALENDPGQGPSAVLFNLNRAPWCAPAEAAAVFDGAGPEDYWRKMTIALASPS